MATKDRSRTLILDAADSAFRELGFAGVSMEEIAKRAGLTRMTVYNLFVSKENIAFAVVARNEGLGSSPFQARIAAGENALRLLEDAFLESARWCRENPTIAPIALAGPPSADRMQPPSGRPSFHGLVGEIMLLGQEQGSIRKDKSAAIMALVLLGSFAQIMLFALSGGPVEDSWITGLVGLSVEGFGVQSHPQLETGRP